MENIANHNSRPTAVKLALVFLLVNGLATTIGGVAYGPWDMRPFYYIFGFGLVLDFLPLWFAFRRKNWARWFVVIYTVFCVCFDPIWGSRFHPTYSIFQWAWFVLSDVLDLAAIVLLFLPSSNLWFRNQKLPPPIHYQ